MRYIIFIIIFSFLGFLNAAEFKINKEYTVIQMNGVAIKKLDGLASPTLTLDDKTKRVAGTSGINRYGGGYELIGDVLTIKQPFSTMMGGSQEAMQVEQEFLKIISVPLKVEITETGILLTGSKGNMLINIK